MKWVEICLCRSYLKYGSMKCHLQVMSGFLIMEEAFVLSFHQTG